MGEELSETIMHMIKRVLSRGIGQMYRHPFRSVIGYGSTGLLGLGMVRPDLMSDLAEWRNAHEFAVWRPHRSFWPSYSMPKVTPGVPTFSRTPTGYQVAGRVAEWEA